MKLISQLAQKAVEDSKRGISLSESAARQIESIKQFFEVAKAERDLEVETALIDAQHALLSAKQDVLDAKTANQALQAALIELRSEIRKSEDKQ